MSVAATHDQSPATRRPDDRSSSPPLRLAGAAGHHLRHLRIGTRMAIVFAGMLLLSMVIGAVALLQLSRVHLAAVEIAERRMPAAITNATIQSQFSRLKELQYRHLFTRDPREWEQVHDAIKTLHADFDKTAADYEARLTNDEQRAAWARFRQARDEYLAVHTELIDVSERGLKVAATDLMNGKARTIYDRALTELTQLTAAHQLEASQARTDGDAVYERAIAGVCGALALMMMLVTAAGVVITRSLTEPMAEAAAFARQVATGNLEQRMTVRYHDEAGEVLRALSAMADGLRDIVSRVRDSSEAIVRCSERMAGGNAELSERTERQFGNLQQTVAALEQLTATVQANAESSRQANQMADSAGAAAEQGRAVVQRMTATMGDIAASSKRVGEIVGVIDGIAFQTNILALNAAVEAARAGEQGRGFAVVASEVRTLAQRSATAAREIKALVAASVSSVRGGVDSSTEAATAIEAIARDAQRVAELIGGVSSATAEQSRGIGDVNVAVTELERSTQANTQLVEHSTSTAGELREHARQLVDAVRLFRVGT